MKKSVMYTERRMIFMDRLIDKQMEENMMDKRKRVLNLHIGL